MMAMARRPEKRSRLTWSGVFFSFVSFIRDAILPISVPMPVAVTTAMALPEVTREPENTILVLSARATADSLPFMALVCFSTLRDSPVRELSFTVNPWTSRSRPSAATRSPVSIIRMSPGTTIEEGMISSAPARMTLASGEDSCFKLSRDFSAFWCCTVPSTALSRRTANMTMALSGSPVSMDTAAAAIRMMTSRSLNWDRNTCHHWSLPLSSSTFSPYFSSLARASPPSIPCRPVSRPFNTSAPDSSCHSAICLSPLPYHISFSGYKSAGVAAKCKIPARYGFRPISQN